MTIFHHKGVLQKDFLHIKFQIILNHFKFN